MATQTISEGTVHKLPADMKKMFSSDVSLFERWEDLTPLARNEWICWTTTVKKAETRNEHIKRMKEELLAGKRRPCCWAGCLHRTDRPLSPTKKWLLAKQSKK